MSSRLHRIQNWPELARSANWSVAVVAKNCSVSVRTLERYFLMQLGESPKSWLKQQRQLHAVKLLQDGRSVKETAAYLGYKYAHHLSRDLNKAYRVGGQLLRDNA
jgi:transcriptional regulator GlxA family with amidase domain